MRNFLNIPTAEFLKILDYKEEDVKDEYPKTRCYSLPGYKKSDIEYSFQEGEFRLKTVLNYSPKTNRPDLNELVFIEQKNTFISSITLEEGFLTVVLDKTKPLDSFLKIK